MKTILLSLILCFSASTFAQNNPLKRGNFMIGGSFSFNRENLDKSDPILSQYEPYLHVKTSSISSDLNLNYLILDNFSLGLTIEGLFSSSKEKFYQNTNYNNFVRNDFFIGPVIRWYIYSGFYLNSSAEFGAYHYDLKEDPIKWRKFLYSTGFGYSAIINESVAIEPAIRYYHQTSQAVKIASGSEKYNGFQFTFGIKLFFNLEKSTNKPTKDEKV